MPHDHAPARPDLLRRRERLPGPDSGKDLQRAEKLLSELVAERREVLALNFVARSPGPIQAVLAGLGELHDVLAPVLQTAVAPDEAFRFEIVNEGNHGRPVDAESLGSLLL